MEDEKETEKEKKRKRKELNLLSSASATSSISGSASSSSGSAVASGISILEALGKGQKALADAAVDAASSMQKGCPSPRLRVPPLLKRARLSLLSALGTDHLP